MHLTLFDYVLWYLTPILQLGILLAMRRRKLHSLYPQFFAYTILQALSVLVLALFLFRSYSPYYYSYFVSLGLCAILSLAVIYESSRIVFDQDDRLLFWLRILWAA